MLERRRWYGLPGLQNKTQKVCLILLEVSFYVSKSRILSVFTWRIGLTWCFYPYLMCKVRRQESIARCTASTNSSYLRARQAEIQKCRCSLSFVLVDNDNIACAHVWFKVSLVCNAKIAIHAKQGQTDRINLHSTLKVPAFGQYELSLIVRPLCACDNQYFCNARRAKYLILHCLRVRRKHVSLSSVCKDNQCREFIVGHKW